MNPVDLNVAVAASTPQPQSTPPAADDPDFQNQAPLQSRMRETESHQAPALRGTDGAWLELVLRQKRYFFQKSQHICLSAKNTLPAGSFSRITEV